MSNDRKPFLSLTASVDENGAISVTHSPITDEQRVLAIFAIDKFLTELTGSIPVVSIAAGKSEGPGVEASEETDDEDLMPDPDIGRLPRSGARWKDNRSL
jgi:hypothetical protein